MPDIESNAAAPDANQSKLNLLLLSGSKAAGNLPVGSDPLGFLEWSKDWIQKFVAETNSTNPFLFVPYARPDGMPENDYFEILKAKTAGWGISWKCAPPEGITKETLQKVAGIFIGGGQTFKLLDKLQYTHSKEVIRDAVNAGLPYIGSSAGTIIASPTIKTVNDMPCPPTNTPDLVALGLVPVQFNCHYLNNDMHDPLHRGETRDTRLFEGSAFNPKMISMGLFEGTALRVVNGSYNIWSSKAARAIIPPVITWGDKKAERVELKCKVDEPYNVTKYFQDTSFLQEALAEEKERKDKERIEKALLSASEAEYPKLIADLRNVMQLIALRKAKMNPEVAAASVATPAESKEDVASTLTISKKLSQSPVISSADVESVADVPAPTKPTPEAVAVAAIAPDDYSRQIRRP